MFENARVEAKYLIIPASGKDMFVTDCIDDRDKDNIKVELMKTPIIGWAIGKEVGEAYPITNEGIQNRDGYILEMFGAYPKYEDPFTASFDDDEQLIEYYKKMVNKKG